MIHSLLSYYNNFCDDFYSKKKTKIENANMIHIISVMMNDVKGKSDMGKEDEGTTTSTIDRSAIVASL